MSQETPKDHISKKRVVYEMPGIDAVATQPEMVFGLNGKDSLTMDLYYPPDVAKGTRLPAVVLVAGFPDAGFQKVVGCKFKEMGSTVSWARLIAASGMVAIAYSNREPAADAHALLGNVRKEAGALGIDETRLGLWASSGNVPLALSMLMKDGETPPKCAVLCYGYLLDLDGSAGVAEAAAKFGFVNPCAGRSAEDLRPDVPLFLARA